jgi:heavy metal response regulator
MKVLIIEDEIKMAEFIKMGFSEEGYICDVAHDGESGLLLARKNMYDVILLDINLPLMDGITLCRNLRTSKITTPVIMLTVLNKVSDKVKGLDSGADDYLTKPFSFEELLARVRAVTRKHQNSSATTLRVDDLELDQITHKVQRNGEEILLTAKEFALLEYMMQHAGSIVTRVMIIERVWEYQFDPITNTLDVFINRLRNKIDRNSGKKLIHTVRGRGYTIKD